TSPGSMPRGESETRAQRRPHSRMTARTDEMQIEAHEGEGFVVELEADEALTITFLGREGIIELAHEDDSRPWIELEASGTSIGGTVDEIVEWATRGRAAERAEAAGVVLT